MQQEEDLTRGEAKIEALLTNLAMKGNLPMNPHSLSLAQVLRHVGRACQRHY